MNGRTEPHLPSVVTSSTMYSVLTFLHCLFSFFHSLLHFLLLLPQIHCLHTSFYLYRISYSSLYFLRQSWLNCPPKQMQSDCIKRWMVFGIREELPYFFTHRSAPVYNSMFETASASEESVDIGPGGCSQNAKELKAVSENSQQAESGE